jgi:protein-L-isoaspartate O-methyltransferase
MTQTSTELLGRDRAPFLPDVVWRGTDEGYVRIDRRTDAQSWRAAAEADCVLVTQWDDGTTTAPDGLPTCSASLPSLVNTMLDVTEVRYGHAVLEVGTGTGYTAALLKDRVGPAGRVVTVEVDPDLSASAQQRLEAAGVDVETVCADGLEGWRAGAPYDRIHVTCGIRRIPTAWLDQCPAGVIMLPWGTALSGGRDRVIALRVKDGVAVGRFGAEVSFMKARSQRPGPWDDWPDTGESAEVDLPVTWDEIEAPLEPFDGFVMGLLLPGVTYRLSGGGGDERVLWLEHGEVSASIGFGDGHKTTVAGGAALAMQYAAAARWWHDHGRPEPERFGLAIGAAGQRAWFDNPEGECWPLG